MDYLEQTARFLMDKGYRKDAIKVKQELVDIKKFYNDVINRVNAYHSELEHVVSKVCHLLMYKFLYVFQSNLIAVVS